MKTLDLTAYYRLFDDYGMTTVAIAQLSACWQEPHRYYHNESHLLFLLNRIQALSDKSLISVKKKDTLLMAAFFHDAVYDPTAADNEEKSAILFRQLTQPRADSALIEEIIIDTKSHKAKNKLSALFCQLDMAVVTQSDFQELLAWEKGIAKEYQFVDYTIYKKHRIGFLQNCIAQFPENTANLQNLVAYLQFHKPCVGIYAGSFNPLHNGHLNILEKAERIFDKVILAKGINPEKEDKAESTHPVAPVLKYRQVENFSGLLTDYITSKEADAEITLVRGLRNGDDLAYEVNQLRFMEDMKPGLKVVFIRCDKQFEHISSSAIRNLEKISKGLGSKYLPFEQ